MLTKVTMDEAWGKGADDGGSGNIYLSPEITVPWRSFKAFVQIFDMAENGFSVKLPNIRFLRRELLVLSNTTAGDTTRAPLLANNLIDIDSDGQITIKRGTPLGREWMCMDAPSCPLVLPHTRSAPGIAWVRTHGRCAYCGEALAFFSQLSLSRFVDSEYQSQLFGCKSCHGLRADRSLEHLRFLFRMKEFQRRNGVKFDHHQLEYLKGIGVELDLRPHLFWFETYDPDEFWDRK